MKKGPLAVGGLYELALDRRRRVILPHRIVPLLADLHRGMVQLFDAISCITSDPRWLEAAELVERASAILRHPSMQFSDVPFEHARSSFESKVGAVRVEVRRKGMAMARPRK
jgi:hypothetical protein